MKTILSGFAAAALSVALSLGAAQAEPQQRVDAKQDWAIFAAGDGQQKVCWIASKPTDTAARRGGQSVEVQRGEIYLMVSFRPGDGARNEVSFQGGYPFKQGSTVEAAVGSDKFEMFTMGENAWTSSNDKDAEIVAAFKRGADAKITGVSSRGTTTIDTFSLQGFTAAVDAAKKLCG